MKTFILIFLLFVTCLKADELVGFDGGCYVYYRPYAGYYEVCGGYPSFLGYEFSAIRWNYGYHRRYGFHNYNHYGWHGNIHRSIAPYRNLSHPVISRGGTGHVHGH